MCISQAFLQRKFTLTQFAFEMFVFEIFMHLEGRQMSRLLWGLYERD